MKIYIDFEKQAIVKITTEDLFEGDIDSNKFIVLFSNYGTNTNWYPTLTQLAPNGREAGAFNADALEDDATHEYTEDDVNYLKYEWTITNEYVLQNGRSNFFIYVNTIKNGGLAKKVYAKFTCVLNESDNQYFVADPEFNPKVKQYIDTYSQLRFDGIGTQAQIEALTENKGIWLCIDAESDYNGYFFYWDDATEQYVPGNVFQATEVADGAITWAKLAAALKRYLVVNGENNTDGRSTGINLDYTNYYEEDREDLVGSRIDLRESFTQIENVDISNTGEQTGRIYITPEVVRLLSSNTTGGIINQSKVEMTPTEIVLSSPTKIGDLLEDYWEFNGDTLWLKGSSHTIESNSGDASITFDDDVLELDADNKVQVNAPTVNVEANTIVLGEEPTSGGGGVTPITPIDSSNLSCLKVIPTATGSNAVVQVKTDTDKIPFEITKDGNIKYTKVQSGTTYNIFANGSIVNFTKTPSGGSANTIMVLDPEQGLIVKNDLLDVDPSQYMTNLVSPFRVGVKTGGSNASTTGTYVSFDNQLSRIDFKTADTSSDLIFMNNVKLVNKNYVDNFSIDLVINPSNFQMYAVLKNASGTTISTSSVIDLPLESVVVSGSYDAVNKKVVLTLQNGSTIEFSVADLIDGLQSEITSQNPLDADLVNDTNAIHKFVNASEKAQITTNATNITSLQSNKADLTNTSQVITADKVKVNEIRDLTGSGNVKTTYTNNSITNEVKYGSYNYNQVAVRDNYARLSYSEFEEAYNSVSVEKTGVYIGVGLVGDRKTLQLSASTKKLTLGGNEIIDTSNATTELFLTDAEMTTLLSEVFD